MMHTKQSITLSARAAMDFFILDLHKKPYLSDSKGVAGTLVIIQVDVEIIFSHG